MQHEYGRSLIEVIGVLAITAVMTAGAIGAYVMIRNNQARAIADADLEQIADDVKMLMEMRGDYTGVSVDYLIKAGALKDGAAPIGGADWSVTASHNGDSFSINLVDLDAGECEHFSMAIPNWASAVMVNGREIGSESYCLEMSGNQVTFIVE